MNTNPNNYRATGSVNAVGKYLHTIITLHYPDGHKKQISKTTGLTNKNKKGDKSAANWKEAKHLLEIRKLDEIAKAVKQAREEAEQARQQAELPKYTDNDILFVDACEAWVARYKKAETTKDAYSLTCRAHLRPYFEPLGLHLSEVTETVLQNYIDYKIEHDHLAGKTVKKQMAVVKGTLKAAKRNGIIDSVFWTDLEYPPDEKFEGTIYTQEEVQILLNACSKSPIRDAVVLISLLGLRRSEVLGLQWKNVDLVKGTIRIKDVTVYVTKTHNKSKPKNTSSDRTLALSSNTVEYLKTLQARQEQNKLDYGNSYHENDYVCKYEDGKPINARCFNENFNKILERNGLKKLRPHDLRHTAATIMIDNGESLTVVQQFLGHRNASTTLDTYIHAFEAREKAATQKLGSAYSL